MRKARVFLAAAAVLFALILPFAGCSLFAESGGQETVYVTSVRQSGEGEEGTEFTVCYSDGTTSTFTVQNGKDGADGQDGQNGQDGEDGQDVTAASLYEEYLAQGGTLSYFEFLRQYLTFPQDNGAAIAQAVRSAVSVRCEYTVTSVTGWQTVKDIAVSQGAGVIYRTDGEYAYIVTNYHVVYNSDANEDNGSNFARKIVCYLYGSENGFFRTGETDADGYSVVDYGTQAIGCEYIGGSVTADIALLRAPLEEMRAVGGGFAAVQVADGYTVGETAIAVGNAEGQGLSVTQGIVSVDGEYISLSDIDGTARRYRSIRVDAAVYHGNSGGGLFNAAGQLIGIVNAGDEEDESINYAIPQEIVCGVADNILYYHAANGGTTRCAYKIALGVTVLGQNSRYVFDEASGSGHIEDDTWLQTVSEGSIAAALGLQAGDVLTAMTIGGETSALLRSYDIGDLLWTVRAGDAISFAYTRGGQRSQTSTYTVQTSDLSAAA